MKLSASEAGTAASEAAAAHFIIRVIPEARGDEISLTAGRRSGLLSPVYSECLLLDRNG